MMFAPLEGWRHVKVTDRHTAVDYAHVLKDLADTHFAHAKTIVLVQDNLSIHSKASLYEAFPAVETRRLVERFQWHYTPKHGSWLDLAESELGVLVPRSPHSRQTNPHRGNRRLGARPQCQPHQGRLAIHHQKNARTKLKHLYPSI
jgi:DDE superfamily endonuclease